MLTQWLFPGHSWETLMPPRSVTATVRRGEEPVLLRAPVLPVHPGAVRSSRRTPQSPRFQEARMTPSAGTLRWSLAGQAAGLVVALWTMAASAQDVVKFKVGNLGFPSHSAMIIGILKEKGFDRKHGIDMEAKAY